MQMRLGSPYTLVISSPCVRTGTGNLKDISCEKVKNELKVAAKEMGQDKIRNERWQGKLFKAREEDQGLDRTACFIWLWERSECPFYKVARMYELYEQLLPTKPYTSKKTKTTSPDNVLCSLCGKRPESVQHILAGCSALAQSKYLERHNSPLKVLLLELLRDLKLIESVPPWYSPVQPKSLYESEDVKAYRDIPVFAEYNEGRANRVDARIVDHQAKTVTTLKMSCPWIQNREKKDEEKVLKYGPLRWELKQQLKGYRLTQYNIITDVLGGWSSSVEVSLSKLLQNKCKEVLKRMQRSIIASSLNIARTFKVVGTWKPFLILRTGVKKIYRLGHLALPVLNCSEIYRLIILFIRTYI